MPEAQDIRVETTAAGARAPLLRLPRGGDPAEPRPLAVMLHGAGGDPQQGLSLLAPWATEAGMLVLAPASAGSTWDAIMGRPGRDLEALVRALEWVQARHAVAADEIAIGGFSDGASCALGMGLSHGDLFRRIVAFSPGFIPQTVLHGRPPVFVCHGTHDTVLPIARCSRVVVPRLRDAGCEVAYREFDAGHVVPPDIARQAVAWLLRGNEPARQGGGQSRDADPRETAA